MESMKSKQQGRKEGGDILEPPLNLAEKGKYNSYVLCNNPEKKEEQR